MMKQVCEGCFGAIAEKVLSEKGTDYAVCKDCYAALTKEENK